jgi:toxin ParE1/3/4
MTEGSGGKFWLRETAIKDLDDLAAYIQQDSAPAAIRFLEAAEGTFELLSRAPELGRLFELPHRMLSGMRVWPIKGFRKILVFYRPVSGGVDVVRVVHGARDFAALFDDEGFPSGD